MFPPAHPSDTLWPVPNSHHIAKSQERDSQLTFVEKTMSDLLRSALRNNDLVRVRIIMLIFFQIFLYDTTMISPFPLVFFGGKISIGREDFQNVIKVDDWIKFQASPNIAKLVKVSISFLFRFRTSLYSSSYVHSILCKNNK